MVTRLLLAVVLLLTACAEPPQASLRLAVAANFRPALEVLRGDFERDCACRLEIVSGATGLLYSQLREGAPIDVFLAADSERPRLLQGAQVIVPGSRQTYARGRLALWVEREAGSDAPPATRGFLPAAQIDPQLLSELLRNWRGKVVVADPQLAPYGEASVQLLRDLKLWSRLRGRVVYAANVAHAQILLREGHARLGLIPLSHAIAGGASGDYMAIGVDQHPPIDQQLVIMSRSRVRPLAERFAAFLLSAETQRRLVEMGYVPVVES